MERTVRLEQQERHVIYEPYQRYALVGFGALLLLSAFFLLVFWAVARVVT